MRLYFISDSCHSGTVAKFAPPIGGSGALPRPRFLPPHVFIKDPKLLASVRRLALQRGSTKETYPALLLAGCKDVEFSYDGTFGGRPNGALTYVALQKLSGNPNSPQSWFKQIRASLPSSDYPQTPQLYGSRKAKQGSMF